MEQSSITVEAIQVGDGRRPVSRHRVSELADSIRLLGLLQPIIVSEQYQLVAGLHRLEAFKLLGRTQIPAQIVGDDALLNQLIEIDENLLRQQLNALEEAVAIAKRKELYVALHPQTQRGGDHKSDAGKSNRQVVGLISFAEDTAAKLGVVPRTIERSVQIGRGLTAESVDALRDTPLADKRTHLLKIARLSAAEQPVAIAQALGTTPTTQEEAPCQQQKKRKHSTPAPSPRPRDRWGRAYSLLEAADVVMDRAGSLPRSVAQLSPTERQAQVVRLQSVQAHLSKWLKALK